MQLRFDIIQNSEEWYDIKIAKFSASIAADLLMDKKNKGYIELIEKISEERMTGTPCESKKWIGNSFTERGHEFEPIAREDYEIRTLEDVKIIGVIEKDDWCLCSPDGLIGDDGLHQIKCPIFRTQKEYLDIVNFHSNLSPNELMRKISGSYYKQMQFELFVSERKFNVFTSYHPKLAPIDIILTRDEELIKQIDTRLIEAKQEVNDRINQLNKYRYE